jgi:DsbC/DsbD-like thiol-disulfide interchange protein
MSASAPRPPLTDRRRALALLASGLGGAVLAGPALAQARAAGVSAWSDGGKGAMRLIDGWSDADGTLIAGVELRLPAGYKTYWRHPGDSGVPPTFDFAASRNLKSVEVLYPAPGRFDDGAGGTAFGYQAGGVIFPLRVTPADPGQPVTLALRIDYGSCKTMCFLVSGDAALVLGGERGPQAALVAPFLARVPRLVAPDQMPLSFAASPEDRARQVAVRLLGDAAARFDLFIEAPEGWFLMAGPAETRPLPGNAAAEHRFSVMIHERPRSGEAPVLRLTLVGEGPRGFEALETTRTLDLALIAP